MTWYDVLLWGVLPYVVVAVLVSGTIWRYRYDRFGWTTRSSQLYESRLLRIGSPLFHFGLLVVIVGHVIGLVIPKSWTDAAGLSQEAYHVQALAARRDRGHLHARRRRHPHLPAAHHRARCSCATTRNDKLMYVVLVAAIVAGLATTLLGAAGGEEHNYRLTVSPWFRSLFVLQPDIAAMSRGGPGLPAARPHRHGAVRVVAVHPARARLHRAGALPVPALHRLPLSRRRNRRAAVAPRLGAGRQPLGGRR